MKTITRTPRSLTILAVVASLSGLLQGCCCLPGPCCFPPGMFTSPQTATTATGGVNLAQPSTTALAGKSTGNLQPAAPATPTVNTTSTATAVPVGSVS